MLAIAVLAVFFVQDAFAHEVRPLLVLSVEGDVSPVDLERLTTVLQAHLADLEVDPRALRVGPLPDSLLERIEEVRHVSARAGAVGVVWVDSAPGTEVYLFVLDQGEGRVITRSIAAGAGEEDRLQTIALLVEASIGPLVPLREVNSPGELRAPPPRAPRASAPTLGLTAGYLAVAVEGDGVLQHGPDAAFELGLGRLRIGIEVGFGTAVDVPLPQGSAGVERVTARPTAGVRLGAGRLTAHLDGGPTVDVAFARAPIDRTTVNAGIGVGAGIDVVVGGPVFVTIRSGADCWITRHDYAAWAGGPRVLQFGRVQPWLGLGMGLRSAP